MPFFWADFVGFPPFGFPRVTPRDFLSLKMCSVIALLVGCSPPLAPYSCQSKYDRLKSNSPFSSSHFAAIAPASSFTMLRTTRSSFWSIAAVHETPMAASEALCQWNEMTWIVRNEMMSSRRAAGHVSSSFYSHVSLRPHSHHNERMGAPSSEAVSLAGHNVFDHQISHTAVRNGGNDLATRVLENSVSAPRGFGSTPWHHLLCFMVGIFPSHITRLTCARSEASD